MTAEGFPGWTAKRPAPFDDIICEVQTVSGGGQGVYGSAAPCRHLLFHNYTPSGRFQDKTSGPTKDYRIPCYWLDSLPGAPGCRAWALEWLKYPNVWYDYDNRTVHLLAWVNLALCEGESEYYTLSAGAQVDTTDYARATDEIINPKQCLVGSVGGEGGGPIFIGGSTSCYAYGRHKTKNVTRAIIHCEGEVFSVVGRLNDVDAEQIIFFYKPYIVATFSDQSPNGPVSDIFPELRVDDTQRYSNPTGDKEYHNVSSRVGSPCFAIEGDLGDLFTLKTFCGTPYRLSLKMLDAPDPRGGIIIDSTSPVDEQHGLLRDVFFIGKSHKMLHIDTRAHFNLRKEDEHYGPIDFRNWMPDGEELEITLVTPQGPAFGVKGWLGPSDPPEREMEPITNWQRNDDCKEQGGPSRDPGDQIAKNSSRDLRPNLKWSPIIPIPLFLPVGSPYTSSPLANPQGAGPAPGGMRTNPDTTVPWWYQKRLGSAPEGPWPFPDPVEPWDDSDRVWDSFMAGCRTGRTAIQGDLTYVDEFGIYDGRDVETAKEKFEGFAYMAGPYFKVDTDKYNWLQLDKSKLPGATSYDTIQQHLGALWATVINLTKICVHLEQTRHIGVATVTSLDPVEFCPCNKDGQTASAVSTKAYNLSPESVVVGEKVLYFKDCEGKICLTKIPQGFTGLVPDGDYGKPMTDVSF